MRGKHQLRPLRIHLRTLEHLHQLVRQVRVHAAIEFINNQQASTIESFENRSENPQEPLRAVRFVVF